MFIKKLEGVHGEITVPSIGLTVATTSTWSLARREESAPGETGDWTLHAVFSFINAFAFEEPSIKKEFVVTLGRRGTGPKYKLEWDETAKVTLIGRGLTVEGVHPWPL